MQAHTNYSGGYELTHPTIAAFWAVVTDLSEEQKRALLKFVTSCSRPPLLGFKVSPVFLKRIKEQWETKFLTFLKTKYFGLISEVEVKV